VPKPIAAGALCNKIAKNIKNPKPLDDAYFSLTINIEDYYFNEKIIDPYRSLRLQVQFHQPLNELLIQQLKL
jgi:hypothetical protein